MSEKRSVAQVRVTKSLHGGHPVAEIAVEGHVSAAALGGLVDKVLNHEEVYKLAGLKACGGCKSGLDINIVDRLGPIIEVQF